jgi:4-aminobutyrate aminotransferase/(S)-3-amino-2-methylpropionate transaminase
VQGRGGIRVAPAGFLPALAAICKQHGIVFITDEIYSGTYRTGTFLAGDLEGLVPDIVCLGKALGGGFPLSVAMMRPHIAEAVKNAGGEAVHTSTFMGWPMSCAAGIGVLKFLGNINPAKETARIEKQVGTAVDCWTQRFDFIKGIRGRGAMLGIMTAPFGNLDCGGVSMAIVREALSRGLILLPEGADAEVVALTPPLIISDNDLKTALKILEQTLETVAGIRPPFAQDPETRRDEKTIKYRKKPK